MKPPSFIKRGSDGQLSHKKGPGESYLSEGIYSPIPLDDDRITRFITEIRKTWLNGGAWIRCVEAAAPHVQESLEYQNYWPEFFKSPYLRGLLPELQVSGEVSFPNGIQHMGRHQFEGALTDLLLGGGAYKKFSGTDVEARQITKECADSFGDFFKSPVGYGVVAIYGGWTPAFYNIAWDATFILGTAQGRKWIVMWMTDTD